jgi:hypothetical protein
MLRKIMSKENNIFNNHRVGGTSNKLKERKMMQYQLYCMERAKTFMPSKRH